MTSIETIKGIGPATAKELADAGYDTAQKIATASIADRAIASSQPLQSAQPAIQPASKL